MAGTVRVTYEFEVWGEDMLELRAQALAELLRVIKEDEGVSWDMNIEVSPAVTAVDGTIVTLRGRVQAEYLGRAPLKPQPDPGWVIQR